LKTKILTYYLHNITLFIHTKEGKQKGHAKECQNIKNAYCFSYIFHMDITPQGPYRIMIYKSVGDVWGPPCFFFAKQLAEKKVSIFALWETNNTPRSSLYSIVHTQN
jgi:hypothetical protein